MRILSLALLVSAAALPAAAQQSAPSASALHLRMLTWPGKVAAPGAAPAPRTAAPASREERRPAPAVVTAAAAPPLRETHADLAWQPAYRPVSHGANHMLGDLTPAQAAAVDAQRAAAEAERAKQAPQPAPRNVEKAAPALPSSIYAPAPPAQAAALAPRPAAPSTAQAPTRVAAASPYDQKAHFYSLHRAYGDSPDPVTLSPQFLAAGSPDLADPPPPPPRVLPGSGATAAQLTAARVQQQNADASAN